jgi:hypothetical protein
MADAFRDLLATALHPAFLIVLAATLAGLSFAFLTPRGTTKQLIAQGEREDRTFF